MVKQWLLLLNGASDTKKFFKWIIAKVLYDKDKYCEHYQQSLFKNLRNRPCMDSIIAINFDEAVRSNADGKLSEFAKKIKDNEDLGAGNYKLFLEKFSEMRNKRR